MHRSVVFEFVMGVNERRERERNQRRTAILDAAWVVAKSQGWASFSVERVAAEAELGRATVYGYFKSLEALVLELAKIALVDLEARISAAPGLLEALDAPVRFAQANPAGFELLFPQARDPRPAFANAELDEVQAHAQKVITPLQRLASRSGAQLPEDAQSAAAFIRGVCLAGAVVPELRQSTTLRRKWQHFVLGDNTPQPSSKAGSRK